MPGLAGVWPASFVTRRITSLCEVLLDDMRFSIAIAAALGGLEAASALRTLPRNLDEKENVVGFRCCFRLEQELALHPAMG